MSQLLRGKHRGRFGAPPDPTHKLQWWRPIPIYIFLPLTVIFVFMGAVSWLTYQSCSGRDQSICLSFKLRPLTTGTYAGMLAATGVLFLIAIVGLVLAPAMLKHWPFWLCWLISLVALVAAVTAFLVLSASFSTPWGGLGPFPPLPTVTPR